MSSTFPDFDRVLEAFERGVPQIGSGEGKAQGQIGQRTWNFTLYDLSSAFHSSTKLTELVSKAAGVELKQLYRQVDEENGTAMELIVGSAHEQIPSWALKIDSYIEIRHGDRQDDEADILLVEGEEAVQALVEKAQEKVCIAAADAIAMEARKFIQGQPERAIELLQRLMQRDPQGFASMWKSHLEGLTLEQSPKAPSSSPRRTL